MNEFPASNGLKVVLTNAGQTAYTAVDGESESTSYLGFAEFLAFREYFRAEEDERLGRWRWPENPDYVVYPSALYKHPADSDEVNVVNTSNGASHRVKRADSPRLFGYFSEAGSAYFDARPEPKPWATAEPGEIWDLTVDGVENRYAAILSHGKNGPYVRMFPTDNVAATTVGTQATAITAGQRIWPEES
ncbi:hypothetical protein [Microbacterium jejuense]|uniref:hypothetical protein n=1 Tax=Microbacterium jejuense TaxID=1263637 RepID=UPI0031E80B49